MSTQRVAPATSFKLDIADLNTGLYFIVVLTQDGESYSDKFVITR
jgi:hypothetical protein